MYIDSLNLACDMQHSCWASTVTLTVELDSVFPVFKVFHLIFFDGFSCDV
jgi:hypothetical protein